MKERAESTLYRSMSPVEQHLQNDLDGLQLIHNFGWLRTRELGPLMWPNSLHARHQADRLVRSWRERRLIIERELPEHAGRAVVLAAKGVRLLADYGIVAKSGKDFGEMSERQWSPPMTWRHDLLATEVLVHLYLQGFEVYPEAQIRRQAGRHEKLPDGLAHKGEQVIYVEVEHARKSGPAMKALAQALCSVAQGNMTPILGLRPTRVLVAFASQQVDERSYALNHRERVRKAVAAIARCAVPLTWASCKTTRPNGVLGIECVTDLVEADRAAAIHRRLDAIGWRDEAGVLVCSYGTRSAAVWEDDEAECWGWQVDDLPGERASNLSEAKRRCAEALAACK